MPEQEFKQILRANPSSVSVFAWENNVQPIRIASGTEGQQLIELLQHTVYTPDYRMFREAYKVKDEIRAYLSPLP